MIDKGLELANTVFSWLKERTLKELLLLVCFIALLFTAWTANSYQKKYIKANTDLGKITNELRIEKDNNKVEERLAEISRLKKELSAVEKENLLIYRDLKELRDMKITRTEIMKEIEYVKDTETACRALADMGHPICE